jgi:hypothetical protein
MAMDTSPRTYRFLNSDILMSGYRIVGKIMATSNGAMGTFNDTSHSSVEVNDARLARLHMPTKLVDHFEMVRMMKKQIHLACMNRREDLGPSALVRGGYNKFIEYSVRMTTQMFEVEGVMELPGRFDFPSMMTDGSRTFIPIFNAVVTAILIPNLRVESAAVMINREKIDLVALLNQRVKAEN